MPVTSKAQFRKVWAIRSKYKSKKNAPKSQKWAFGKEWTDVDYDSLPNKVSDSFVNILSFSEFRLL